MKTMISKRINLTLAFLVPAIISLMIVMNSCEKDDNGNNNVEKNYTEVNLVANSAIYTGARLDASLVNAWGIAFSPTGNAWISSADGNVSVVYDHNGVQVLAAVAIPTATANIGGAPTGQVYNSTTSFKLSNSNPAKFIFAGEDGVISGWNTGIAAERVINRSTTSVYLGITIASNAGNNYIYAANFKTGHIDVFDSAFASVSMTFTDPTLPAGYYPFNIQLVAGQLYVMYAQLDPATGDEKKGAGFGYVSVFNTDGSFVKRFVSQGALNAPWGIAQAPAAFIDHSTAGAILIGNFGDGKINAYDASGNWMGSLKSNGNAIVIDGLWGLAFSSASGVNPNWLYFTAGPNDENDGLFGYIY